MDNTKNDIKLRIAYLRSRQLEKWVHGYVLKMEQFPAPKYTKGGSEYVGHN